jgi:hypothetical protein
MGGSKVGGEMPRRARSSLFLPPAVFFFDQAVFRRLSFFFFMHQCLYVAAAQMRRDVAEHGNTRWKWGACALQPTIALCRVGHARAGVELVRAVGGAAGLIERGGSACCASAGRCCRRVPG